MSVDFLDFPTILSFFSVWTVEDKNLSDQVIEYFWVTKFTVFAERKLWLKKSNQNVVCCLNQALANVA